MNNKYKPSDYIPDIIILKTKHSDSFDFNLYMGQINILGEYDGNPPQKADHMKDMFRELPFTSILFCKILESNGVPRLEYVTQFDTSTQIKDLMSKGLLESTVKEMFSDWMGDYYAELQIQQEDAKNGDERIQAKAE